jgi:hypothetical protein
MTLLNNQQKQLLFDYCLGLTSDKDTAEAEALISSNEEAAEIHSKLKAALAPLDSLETDTCPEELVEGTIWRLNNFARSSQLRLRELLATEQARDVSTKSRLGWNLGRRLAMAAVFMIVGGALITTLNIISNYSRQKSWRYRCGTQLGSIFQGLSNYISDYDGQMPAVATTTGAPWWKVGYQGKENHSNTRHIWLLLKHRYTDPNDFVCKARKRKFVVRFDPSQMKNYNDFPSREHMTYSVRIWCKKPTTVMLSKRVLMSDLSPLFEMLPSYSTPLKLRLDEDKELSTRNSINHRRRGQNVLSGDGGVKFIRVRYTGIEKDDIYTLQGIRFYQGNERPSRDADIFVAP